MTAAAGVRLTIGELAQAAGMTVRNIRNHQSRGLLPPPEVSRAHRATTAPSTSSGCG